MEPSKPPKLSKRYVHVLKGVNYKTSIIDSCGVAFVQLL